MKQLLLTIIFLSSWIVSNDLQAMENKIKIDCADAPSSAQVTISHPKVHKWVRISCTIYGHILAPVEGGVWTYYFGFTPFVIPAQSFQPKVEPEKVGHTVHFVNINITDLSAEESASIRSRGIQGDKYPSHQMPNLLSLQAETNSGSILTMYFEQNGITGLASHPDPLEAKRGKLFPFIVADEDKLKEKFKIKKQQIPSPSERIKKIRELARLNHCDGDDIIVTKPPEVEGKYTAKCSNKTLVFMCEIRNSWFCYLI